MDNEHRYGPGRNVAAAAARIAAEREALQQSIAVATAPRSEVLALRLIVMSMISEMAAQHAESGGNPQSFINALAVKASEALAPPLGQLPETLGDDVDLRRIKREALHHIKDILAGIRTPQQRNEAH